MYVQVRTALQLSGLEFFKLDKTVKMWLNWRHWPHMNLGQDMGPDAFAAVNWFKWKGINITIWNDFSHGIWIDMKGFLKDMNLFNVSCCLW